MGRRAFVNPALAIRHVTATDRDWLKEILERNWGGTRIVVHGREFDCLNLPALIAGERRGILIYRAAELAEIVLLESFDPGTGLGTALIHALIEELGKQHVSTLRVTTTNDNVEALRFYQRRGFRLRELRVGAVDRARILKPSIPEIGMHSIPLRDELELELPIRHSK